MNEICKKLNNIASIGSIQRTSVNLTAKLNDYVMEKKTKKLQLRKETIAVLNGERMTNVIGGGSGPTDNPCGPNAIYIEFDKRCLCPAGYEGNPYKECIPVNQSDAVCTNLCNTALIIIANKIMS